MEYSVPSCKAWGGQDTLPLGMGEHSYKVLLVYSKREDWG